jgi:hypothetical protein
MRPDNRRIDHLQRDITCATSGKRLQDHVEDAAIGPASKLPEDRIPVAKFLRQVTPRRARPHLPKNRIKHTAMVARRSATTSDKERFEIRPLIVRHQPANHSCSPQRTALNQFTILQSITLSTAPRDRSQASIGAGPPRRASGDREIWGADNCSATRRFAVGSVAATL